MSTLTKTGQGLSVRIRSSDDTDAGFAGHVLSRRLGGQFGAGPAGRPSYAFRVALHYKPSAPFSAVA